MNSAALNLITPIEKKCTKCGVIKSLTDFSIEKKIKNGPISHGRKSECKKCCSDRNRRYFLSLPEETRKQQREKFQRGEYARSASYKRLYGITLEDVRRMHQDQMGLCANRGCGTELDVDIPKPHKNKAVVDHCHTTGKVRGLLCFRCNTTLGLMEDKNVVFGLTEYLHKHGQSLAFSKKE